MKQQISNTEAITAQLEPLYPLGQEDMAVKVKDGINKHLKNGCILFFPTGTSNISTCTFNLIKLK